MTSDELRKKYLEFFESKGHKIIPSASLIPENNPTVLFTTAGMHPLVPFLLGEKHPAGDKLVSIQKCIRTGDIDEIGDDTHLTFFEMLGNWGLGSYFKKEAIEWSYEFLTSEKWLGLDKNKISVSCFAGDENAPKDDESAEIWKSLDIPEEKIKFLGKEDNWWGPAGETGPCGPDTEMFFNDIEIWNDVFMQYNKTAEGKFESLSQKNVDTGMGLERTVAVLNRQGNVYETDLFEPIMRQIKDFLPSIDLGSQRIIADHIKASVFLLSEGIEPSNKDRGYVLRKLIRRAVAYANKNDMKFDSKKFKLIAQTVIDIYKDTYKELEKVGILDKLSLEIRKFRATIEKGLKEFEKGIDPFVLFTTYGFPFELTKELAKEKGTEIDEEKFNEEMKKHQELSRTASSGMFKGGLSDTGEENKKLHTATHLLLGALRKVLDKDIVQKGSNITTERLRFDFNWPEKLTADQLKAVEDLVNEKIQQKIPVEMLELPKEEAVKMVGALSFDLSKYGDKVKVYRIGDLSNLSGQAFSAEFCGGPHVANTGDLAGVSDPERQSKGPFKILKEEASSQGVRRIKAILE